MASSNSQAEQIASRAPAVQESKNRNLILRLVTALVLIPIVLACIYAGGLALTILVGVASALNALELSAMALGKRDSLRILVGLVALAMPFFFLYPQLGQANLQWLWVALTIIVLTWRLLRNAPVDTAGRDVSVSVFAAVYGSLVGYVVPLRDVGPQYQWAAGGWVVLACVLTWFNDTGAYFAGRFLGKHKLYPRISPAKTWEGFLGGMIASIAGAFGVRALLLAALSPLDCLVLGIIGGIFGPVGDLAESMLKRSYGVKDSGTILPGHGGMLDRVDALIINAPIVYLYYQHIVTPRGGH